MGAIACVHQSREWLSAVSRSRSLTTPLRPAALCALAAEDREEQEELRALREQGLLRAPPATGLAARRVDHLRMHSRAARSLPPAAGWAGSAHRSGLPQLRGRRLPSPSCEACSWVPSPVFLATLPFWLLIASQTTLTPLSPRPPSGLATSPGACSSRLRRPLACSSHSERVSSAAPGRRRGTGRPGRRGLTRRRRDAAQSCEPHRARAAPADSSRPCVRWGARGGPSLNPGGRAHTQILLPIYQRCFLCTLAWLLFWLWLWPWLCM